MGLYHYSVFSSNTTTIMILFLLCVVPLVYGGLVPDQPDLVLGHGGTYQPPIDQDYYSPNEIYKIKDKDVYEKNCTSVIEESEHRECFDVTELVCKLVENIQYEMVDETYTVQRCTRVTDRVCDTVYDLDVTTRDDFQCIDLEHQYCWDEEKIVKDRTASSASTLNVASIRTRMIRELSSVRKYP